MPLKRLKTLNMGAAGCCETLPHIYQTEEVNLHRLNEQQ